MLVFIQRGHGMEINILEQIKDIAQAFDVQYTVLNQDSNLDTELDNRIYRVLGIERNYHYSIETALEVCEEHRTPYKENPNLKQS